MISYRFKLCALALCAFVPLAACGAEDDDGSLPPEEDTSVGDDTTGGDVGGEDATEDAPDSGPECGDGEVNADDEECDGSDLAGVSCVDRGFVGGDLACTSGCLFDETGCTSDPVQTCGNDELEGDEECDGTALGDATCATFDFAYGRLGCTDTCEYDTTGCNDVAVCGDGIEEGDEECDDGDTVDGDGCDKDCLDEVCGDGIVQPGLGEECDTGAVVTYSCDDVEGAVGIVYCAAGCVFEEYLCPDAGTCGNGELDLGEACDDGGNEDGDGCAADCTSENCDNGSLDANEACDGDNLGGFVCQDFGFNAGEMACDTCAIDFTGCFNSVCGDGEVNGPEQCDDGNRISGDGCDRRCQDEACDDPQTWYPDYDGDGYGNEAAGYTACEAPDGWINIGGDCDDRDYDRNPGYLEFCNGYDDDCDDAVDESTAERTLCTLLDGTVESSACTEGVCEITECTTYALDCNGEWADGCEASEDDLGNCGGCGNVCEADFATTECSTFSCLIESCDEGYYDINESIDDGCEYGCTYEGDEVCGNSSDDDCDGVTDEDTCVDLGGIAAGGPADEIYHFSIVGLEDPPFLSTQQPWNVATFGDLDGAGGMDLIIGSTEQDSNKGWLFGFIAPYSDSDRTANMSDFTMTGPDYWQYFGATTFGDFNGDTYTDIAVGASGSGEVFVWYGDNDWTTDPPTPANADIVYTETGRQTGSNVFAADLDGDDDAELIITHEGGNSGVSILGVGGSLPATGSTPSEVGLFYGQDGSNENVGTGVVAGDFDGDGDMDVAVGSGYDVPNPGEGNHGRLSLIEGPFAAGPAATTISSAATITMTGTVNQAKFCDDVSMMPSMNGNLSDDIICETTGGNVFVVDFALLSDGDNPDTDALLNVSILGVTSFESEGSAGGDFNGDGIGDLAVGSPGSGTQRQGAIGVFYGHNDHSGEVDVLDADVVITGAENNHELGSYVAVGDYTGDGNDDLLGVAKRAAVGGRAYFFQGGEAP